MVAKRSTTKKAATKKAPAKKKQPAQRGERRAMLDEIGIDAICGMFAAGMMQKQIARQLGIADCVLISWLAADDKRSARAREAKARGASMWDEMALEELQGIPDEATPGQITRAREIASHYRWRASKLGRAEYGEKSEVQHTGKDGGPIETSATVAYSAEEAYLIAIKGKK